jgi:hypothetical protein
MKKHIVSIAALSLMLSACSGASLLSEPDYAFDHTGMLVQNEPGLTPAAWYIKYTDGTTADQTMRVVFNEDSECVVAGKRGECERSVFQKDMNVRIGGTPENGMVTVGVMEVLP